MRTVSKAVGPALLFALCGGAMAAPIETLVLPPASDPAPLTSDGGIGDATNRVVLVTPTSSGTVRSLRISGLLSANAVGTFGSEARIQVTPPGGEPITITPFAGAAGFTTLDLTDFAVDVPDVAANSGDWEIRFYEDLDDEGVDGLWADGLTIVLDDSPMELTPPAATNLGALPVGPSSVAEVNIAPGSVTWYRFTTTGAEGVNGTFLDIDTEGSGDRDTQIALYSSSGSVVASNDDSGTDALSVLTFGTGTRCPLSNGAAYDGSDGDLPAGEYYVAVGYFSATFLPRFGVESDDTEGGTARLNFNTGVQQATATPVPTAQLGSITGAQPVSTTLTAAVPAGGAVWYRFDVPAGITGPVAREFLDIDTEGGATPGVLVVYTDTGDLVASDVNGGSNTNGQLSFGQGFRAPAGDGLIYDGSNGNLAPGSYYLAVATGELGAAANGFVLCVGGDGGTVTVNIRSGVQPAAQAPAATDLGRITLANPNVAATGVNIGERETKWFRFSHELDNTSADFFLDIDTEGSLLTPNNDTVISLYDNNGTIVAAQRILAIDDNGGSDNLSQLSFGNAPARAAVDNGLPYSNRNRTLRPGTYYLAVTGAPFRFRPTEFAVFSVSQNTGTVNVNIRTSLGGGPVPCLADVNGDGTVDGTDFILFINAFAIGDATVDPAADVAGGGNPALPEGGADGTIDGTDFIAFINAFAAGC